jgi:hypothetical protein
MAIDAVGTTRPRTGTLRESSLDERLHYIDIDCHILTRRMLRPGVTAAHLVVAPSGVWVIASRRYEGRPSPQGGALSRRTQILQLGSRSATRLVNGVARQAEIVRSELGPDIPVAAMLCILDADWPIFGGAFTVDGVRVLWPKKACEVIETGHHLGKAQIDEVQQHLAEAFPFAPKRHDVRSRAG